jgi:hypothetical protein
LWIKVAGPGTIARRRILKMKIVPGAFEVRSTQDCGWNTFIRKGRSTDPRDIRVNEAFLDHLAEAGFNWLFVFWTHAPAFDEAWARVSERAHARGIRLARAIYVFAGSETGEEYDPGTDVMGEPGVPSHLLRTSAWGTRSALCPHDPETLAWVRATLKRRVEPSIDGVLFEPPSGLSEECACDRCRAMDRFALDCLMSRIVTDALQAMKPGLEVMLHFNAAPRMRRGHRAAVTRQEIASGLRSLPAPIRRVFGWLTDMTETDRDTVESLVDWLEADPRFQAYTRLSRVILFPRGTTPEASLKQRIADSFLWARTAAERGKTAYSYDWRLFGGKEWEGHEADTPSTRTCARLPASLALMGATMTEPFLDAKGQEDLLKKLRASTEWDLDDPAAFYRGL